MTDTRIAVGQSTTTPLSQTKRRELAVKVYVDEKGYIQNAGFTLRRVTALEKGAISGPKAIVLHRTDSTGVASPLKSFESGVGTHFIVDKGGVVYQTASLLKKTSHIGKIRSRCFESNDCSAEETKRIRSWGWAPTKIHDHEKVKAYPHRYPMNEDSVGIEVVADHNGSAWEAPTAEQSKSIRAIIAILKKEYGITDDDIYEHDKISYKTPGEGAGLYDADVVEPPPVVQPRYPVHGSN